MHVILYLNRMKNKSHIVPLMDAKISQIPGSFHDKSKTDTEGMHLNIIKDICNESTAKTQ